MQTRFGPRVKVDINIVSEIDKTLREQISFVRGNRFEGHAYDISIVGIGLTSKYFLPKGLIIQTEIDGAAFGLDKPMKLKGKVRHCEYVKKESYKCGIKFLNLSTEHKKAIAKLVSTYEKRKNMRLGLS